MQIKSPVGEGTSKSVPARVVFQNMTANNNGKLLPIHRLTPEVPASCIHFS